MAKITSGPTWRRYRYRDGWKVALLTVPIAAALNAYVCLLPHDARETVRLERLASFRYVFTASFLAIGIGALLVRREVFVDAAGFVRTDRGWGPFISSRTVDLATVDHVSATTMAAGWGNVRIPLLGLSTGSGAEAAFVRLATFADNRQLHAEAAVLGALISKPVYTSADASAL